MAEIKRLEVPEPLSRLGEAFREAGHELYLVGGYVRDRLLGGAHPDIDATTDAHPKEIKHLLRPRAEHLWTVGERFGTIGARVGGYMVEVTTYRTDLYARGSRHPEVRFGASLEEDLARRDFTINALAADVLTGEVLDPFEGRRDLESGIIRPVGDPLERMRDDPLRMLRAVRFQTTLSIPE
ncbi:MAG TPA: CCA tRNA nucleotidyltransferase, partial [Rubrobacter sp.]